MDNLNNLAKVLIGLAIIVVLGLFGALFYRAAFLTFVEPTEFAYSYDYRTGEMDSLTRSGYFRTCPFIYVVHTIDLRPAQASINANNRVLNAKLLQFDPKGWRLFVSWHGRADYSNENGLTEILKSYAYDGTKNEYPFLRIKREMKTNEIEPLDEKMIINSPIQSTDTVKNENNH